MEPLTPRWWAGWGPLVCSVTDMAHFVPVCHWHGSYPQIWLNHYNNEFIWTFREHWFPKRWLFKYMYVVTYFCSLFCSPLFLWPFVFSVFSCDFDHQSCTFTCVRGRCIFWTVSHCILCLCPVLVHFLNRVTLYTVFVSSAGAFSEPCHPLYTVFVSSAGAFSKLCHTVYCV